MKNKSFSKLAFSFALAALMLVLGASILTAQPELTKVVSDCPANECPSVVPNNYAHDGFCTFDYGHCVLQCVNWENLTGGADCYNNCNWQ